LQNQGRDLDMITKWGVIAFILIWLTSAVGISPVSLVSQSWAKSKGSSAKKRNARRRRRRRSSRSFSLGDAEIHAQIRQPQVLYLVQQAVFDLEIPRPQQNPQTWILDTAYLAVFDP